MPVAIWFNSPILINIQILVVSPEKLIRFSLKNVLLRISAAHNKFNIGMKVIRTFNPNAGPKYVAADWIFSVYGFFSSCLFRFAVIRTHFSGRSKWTKRRENISGEKEDWSNGRWQTCIKSNQSLHFYFNLFSLAIAVHIQWHLIESRMSILCFNWLNFFFPAIDLSQFNFVWCGNAGCCYIIKCPFIAQ